MWKLFVPLYRDKFQSAVIASLGILSQERSTVPLLCCVELYSYRITHHKGREIKWN